MTARTRALSSSTNGASTTATAGVRTHAGSITERRVPGCSMNPTETLAKPKSSRRCDVVIPPGTLLSTLEWDRGERAWAHRKPSCDEVRETPSVTPPLSGVAPTNGGVPEDPARLAWSVTVEIHEAQDPALGKRVIRIARLHFSTVKEAREIADLLRNQG
jgi:hypothetical protein